MKLNIIEDLYAKTKNIGMERRVLGAFIKNYDYFLKYYNSLNADIFYDPLNKMVFNAMTQSKSSFFDKSIISDKMNAGESMLEKIEEIASAGSEMETALQEHIKAIREWDVRRKMLLHVQDIYLGVINRDNIFELGEKSRKKLSDTFNITGHSKSGFEILKEFHYSYDDPVQHIPSGIKSLDDIIFGFAKKSVTIVAGRPSMGKTALGLNIAYNIAKQGFKVPFFSIEMDNKQVITRLISIDTGIPISSLRNKEIYESNTDKMSALFDLIKDDRLILEDEVNQLDDIINKIRHFKIKYEIDAVVIDYLQLIKYSNSNRSREQEVAYISQCVKNDIAKAMDIPVILLAQLSRQTESRASNEPRMSDLRESGSIENDADNIILIHRADYYDKNEMGKAEQPAELIVAKGRNCGTGKADTIFKLKTNKFDEDTYDPILTLNGMEDDTTHI